MEAVTARRAMISEISALMATHFKENAAFFARLVNLDWGFGIDEMGPCWWRMGGSWGISACTIRAGWCAGRNGRFAPCSAWWWTLRFAGAAPT